MPTNANPHLWTNQPDAEALNGLQGRGPDINFWGVAKLERHLIVNQATRGFESLRPSQSLLWCSSKAQERPSRKREDAGSTPVTTASEFTGAWLNPPERDLRGPWSERGGRVLTPRPKPTVAG
jgi:hypothetical protein